jgi:hypothetical protein
MKAPKEKATNTRRQRIIYVRSLRDLTREQVEFARGFKIVHRRARVGAPTERMIRVVLYSERDQARILELKRRLREAGFDPSAR